MDLSALADLNLDGKVGIGQLRARGIKVSDLRVTMKAAGGKLAVAPVTAALYGGRLAATANVKAGAKPAGNRIDAGADLSGISIGPLLRDVANKDLLEGQGNVKLSAQQRRRHASGRSSAASTAPPPSTCSNGAIKGINLGETIRNRAQPAAGRRQVRDQGVGLPQEDRLHRARASAS